MGVGDHHRTRQTPTVLKADLENGKTETVGKGKGQPTRITPPPTTRWVSGAPVRPGCACERVVWGRGGDGARAGVRVAGLLRGEGRDALDELRERIGPPVPKKTPACFCSRAPKHEGQFDVQDLS